MAKTDSHGAPSQVSDTGRADPAAVKGALTVLDGEATLGEIAAELGTRPSAVSPALSTLAEWGVVENPEGERWRQTDADKRDATAAFDDRASDMACPLGCGYRPMTARDAARHLAAHVTGTHTTGEEQLRKREEYVR